MNLLVNLQCKLSLTIVFLLGVIRIHFYCLHFLLYVEMWQCKTQNFNIGGISLQTHQWWQTYYTHKFCKKIEDCLCFYSLNVFFFHFSPKKFFCLFFQDFFFKFIFYTPSEVWRSCIFPIFSAFPIGDNWHYFWWKNAFLGFHLVWLCVKRILRCKTDSGT